MLGFSGRIISLLDNRNSWASYAMPSAALQKNSIACLGAGEQSGAMEPFSDRSLPSHGLVIVTSGEGIYRGGDGRHQPIASPALIWLYPGLSHSYGPDRAGWTEHWILFSGPAARIYEHLGLADPSQPVVTLKQPPPQLDYLFGLLRRELVVPGIRVQLRASILAQRILEACVIESPGGGAPDDSRKIIEELESSAFVTMSMHARARQFGISVAELREAVRVATGLSPLEFILEVRLARARTLLAETRMDVQLVGAEIGFADPAYFSRFFARRVGVSPVAFRRQQYRGPASD
jgi:AraC-like DNA-binding protein